ncbi:serine/threonine-protein kinase SKY1 [Eurytemora carolleeae]|uniref:serine/threonine-protein kinase SKY1 n=1 Tax=Eurytemora carolleeae TaxID=1294199 RepID=UPI000C77DC2F|nr:serine/threonine-protein kinase SKY1 [Eurytemora carolleeae]|eukprot:XP_023325063.1 serine/threonine-protein kinase SKY1-like [Eurytemora affinis]
MNSKQVQGKRKLEDYLKMVNRPCRVMIRNIPAPLQQFYFSGKLQNIVDGASPGSKVKSMKPGSKKKETVPKKTKPKKYVPMKEPLLMKKHVSMQEESGDSECCKGEIKVGDVFVGESKTKYKVVEVLNMADFSEIWRVEDISTNKRFILKFVNIKLHKTLTETEIHILKKAQNSRKREENYIVSLIDTCEAWKDRCPHSLLILEELGDSLLKIIQGARPRLDYVKQIVQEILLGLDFLHTRCKYIHCDIKPENILLRQEYKGDRNQKMIKIIDVGISRKSRPSYRGEIQTREYRAPEVLTGELGRKYNLTEKVDIWSVGCVLFELITGEFLFKPKEDTDFDHRAEIEKVIGSFCGQSGSKTESLSVSQRILRTSRLTCAEVFELHSFLKFVLVLDPAVRPSAKECLEHKFFM